MGKIILFIVGAFILYNLRARVIRHIAKHQKGRWLWLHILITGTISCLLVFFFPKIIAAVGINQEAFINSINITTILAYVGYLAIAGLIVYLGYIRQLRDKSFGTRLVLFGILFVAIAGGGLLLNFPAFIIYFSIVAFAEEYIKYIFGRSLFVKLRLHRTDLLLFCLISGFAFAFIENGVYAWYAVQKNTIPGLMPTLGAIFQTLTQRGIVNVAVHGFFTSIIGWFTLLPVMQAKQEELAEDAKKQEETKSATLDTQTAPQTPFFRLIGGILLGVGIHTIFNSMVSKGIVFVMPLVVLASYITVSFILYKADTLFNQPK